MKVMTENRYIKHYYNPKMGQKIIGKRSYKMYTIEHGKRVDNISFFLFFLF